MRDLFFLLCLNNKHLDVLSQEPKQSQHSKTPPVEEERLTVFDHDEEQDLKRSNKPLSKGPVHTLLFIDGLPEFILFFCVGGGQRTTCGSWFSHSTMWISGIGS